MGLIVVRYGEIALKGRNQSTFIRRLRRNMRDCLKRHGIEGSVSSVRGRVYVETERVNEATAALSRVFGIVSLSPAVSVDPALAAIKRGVLDLARDAGLDASRSFRVRVKRADKSYPITSPEVSRLVGEHVQEETGGRIDLSNGADITLGVEIRHEGTRLFGSTVQGPGGLPLNSGGRVVALMSGGIDSPVAAWMMMKRGCAVIPVHFSQSEVETAKALDNCRVLQGWSYGWEIKPIVRDHGEAFGDTVAALHRMGASRWICVFCKRLLMLRASRIAEEHGASAIVTGENVGQVASQTLQNMEAISFGVPKPILRPLIAFDKVDITALAKRIGTFDVSIRDSAPCPFLPDHPLTMARMREFQDVLAELRSLGLDGSE